jgi:hypothetical protein
MADTQWCFWLKTILTKIKRGQFSSRFLNRRNAFIAQKIENIMSQKSNYNFSSLNFAVDFIRQWQIFEETPLSAHFCVREYSPYHLLSFDSQAIYFVRPYIQYCTSPVE